MRVKVGRRGGIVHESQGVLLPGHHAYYRGRASPSAAGGASRNAIPE
jgi:hypothetical protein